MEILWRSFDAGFINGVINHPDVFPWVKLPDMDSIDLSDAVADARNVLLVTEHGGFFYLHKGCGAYEVHSQMLPSGRGEHALEAARASVQWMFDNTDCILILTFVPEPNVPAKRLAQNVGFRVVEKIKDYWPIKGRKVDCDLMILEKPTCQLQP